MNTLLLNYGKYNYWANKEVLRMVGKAGKEAMTKSLVSSFPTIRQTLLHIWDAEQIWYERLRGSSPATWPSRELDEDYNDFDIYMLQSSENLCSYIEKLEPGDYEKTIHYMDLKGGMHQQKIWQMLMHCFNHSTFHRGQIVTMLRNAGFDQLGSTDMISWFRLQQEGGDPELDKVYGSGR